MGGAQVSSLAAEAGHAGERATEARARWATEAGERRAVRPHVLTGSKGQERRRAKRDIKQIFLIFC